MNYVKQAFAINETQKIAAQKLYKKAVAKLVNKQYIPWVEDAHTELSAIFGVMWLSERCQEGPRTPDLNFYASANVAFNYANLNLGAQGKFKSLAKSLVSEQEIVADQRLDAMTEQMNSILTCTTPEAFDLAFSH